VEGWTPTDEQVRAGEPPRPVYEDIWAPKNSPAGFLLAACAVAGGFAVVWHIWCSRSWPARRLACDRLLLREHGSVHFRQRGRPARPPRQLFRSGARGRHVQCIDRNGGRARAGALPTRDETRCDRLRILRLPLSDAILFSALFATFAVLRTATAATHARDLFDVATSGWNRLSADQQLVCGLAIRRRGAQAAQAHGPARRVFLLGATFLGLEIREFAGMIAAGAGPHRSAFLSPSSRLWAPTACTSPWPDLVGLLVPTSRPWVSPRATTAGSLLSLFWHVPDVV